MGFRKLSRVSGIGLAVVSLLVFGCSKKDFSSPAKATTSNGLYPTVTPFCSTPAQFGNTTQGLNWAGYSDYAVGTRFTLSTPGTLYSMSAYIHRTGSGRGASMRTAVYTDSGSRPGTLLAQSGAPEAFGGWNEIDVPNIYLPAGTYWLMLQTKVVLNQYDTGAANSGVAISSIFNPSWGDTSIPVAPFPDVLSGSSSTLTNYNYSVYANICP